MRRNNQSIIIVSIIFILVIVCAIVAYLFLMTDMFKSNKELFVKYFAQNEETFKEIMDSQITTIYEDFVKQSKYESKTTVKMTNSEGGEISNLINDFSAQIDIQKNDEEQYLYADAQMIYKDEECLEAEIMKDQELYGIKFPGISRKFVTIQDDDKLENIANELGIDVSYLETIMNILDGNVQINSTEQVSALKSKYINIITTAISNGTFEKQKDALITYNDVTTKTNSYSVTLNAEQVKNLSLEILNNLKTDMDSFEELQLAREQIEKIINDAIESVNDALEIPTIKVTIYEQKQQTIRTVIQIGAYKVIFENTEANGEITSKINYINDDETVQYEFEIKKAYVENKENFETTIDAIVGEESYTISILNEMQLSDNEINVNTEISHKQDITTTAIVLENKLITGGNFEKSISLTDDNIVLLNTLDEGIRKQFIAELKERMPIKIEGKIDEKLEKPTEDPEIEGEMSQVEINKFNAKFEFYTGEEVSEENVKKLLEIVKNNIVGHVITDIEDTETTSSNKKTKNMITIYIEKDKTNEQSMTEILANIEKNKKYKVSISYKESNGLIDSISIVQK